MSRYICCIGGIILALSSVLAAEITVPEGFVIDTLLDEIDGTTPRLEAIRNPDYGFGVVAASVDSGILKVLHISQSSVELLGTMPGFPAISTVGALRFDKGGFFGNKLYVSISRYVEGDSLLVRVLSSGQIETMLDSPGDPSNKLGFTFDFTTGAGGYWAVAYLEDRNGTGGTSLYHMDTDFNLTKLSQDHVPPGRTDMDVQGMEFDPTGLYGSYLTMADSDRNNDQKTVIYQLLPDLSWAELTEVVHTDDRYYEDMCFSSGGSFGEQLYVTERVTDTITSVDPNGVHSVFASGFYEIESITVSEDGEHMFVSDRNGIYRIRAATTTVGPTIVMREPLVEDDDVHTGPSGVDNLRLLWSERVMFENADVNCVDEDGNSVPFSVSGSNSAFMIITFGETLLHDKYTITISDSVQSAEAGAAIDGDNDGFAGGAAIVVMEHRRRSDFDNDNDLDFNDFANFATNWVWQE